MTPSELKTYLYRLIKRNIKIATMIWGPPGIGKSSIVKQIADKLGIGFIDLRLSQLAPTDLRGLPVADHNNNTSRWYFPEFLPTEGNGILFLDELNMAPPALQGVAQQLILDRRVGSYVVPEGWFVWAAGNRREDRAAVFEMPAPLANRFLHLQVEPNFDSFIVHALETQVHEDIIAVVNYKNSLLFKFEPHQPAWCSPRSWVMASNLHYVGLDIASAVGEEAAAEFRASIALKKALPDLNLVLAGNGSKIAFPKELSLGHTVVTSLIVKAENAEQACNAFNWLIDKAVAEWVHLFAKDIITQMRIRGQLGALAILVQQDSKLQQFLKDYRELLGF